MPKQKKKQLLNIYMNIAENSGVGYYRQFLPAMALRQAGLANVLINDFTWGEVRLFCHNLYPNCKYISFGSNTDLAIDDYTKHAATVHKRILTPDEQSQYRQNLIDMVEPSVETLNKLGHWADIIVAGRRDTPNYLSQWKGISNFFNIPIVIDTDDNVYATRPFNPGYRGYHPGSEALMWNKKTMQQVDAVTVSTQNLKNIHGKDNSHIYVLPNALEFERWSKAAKPTHVGEIRIGLLLSSAHHEDAKILEKVIPAILQKHPHVKFYFTNIFAYIFTKTIEQFPKQMIPISWIPLKSWPEQVVALGLDIGLAPLADNMFNRAKSNLRYLEYSAAGMATIASPVEPYRDTITHTKTGLLASTQDEWINYLDTLIVDAKYRKKLSSNAHKLIGEKFDAFKNASKFLAAYQEIVTDFARVRGKRKFDFQKQAFPKKKPGSAHSQVSALVS